MTEKFNHLIDPETHGKLHHIGATLFANNGQQYPVVGGMHSVTSGYGFLRPSSIRTQVWHCLNRAWRAACASPCQVSRASGC